MDRGNPGNPAAADGPGVPISKNGASSGAVARAAQRHPAHGSTESSLRPLHVSVPTSSGSSLASSVRVLMSRQLGDDFATVRFHSDGEAATVSERIGARAFTIGHDIYFNRGN